MMSVFKNAKMTTKTRKTIELASEVLQVKAVHLRKDRNAVDEMTRMLENEGYEWLPAKQEWARITQPLPLEHMKHFALTCEIAQADVMLMLLQAGAEALGVHVALMQRIDTTDKEGALSQMLMEMSE
jgi:hypothetical protein